ncbi:hypothetical protein GCM10007853_02790 [Algimonas ampicilliniresistens]|jgi:hypothetical protein|uniref:Lipoprotein n=1 Tax=Algimonas ampicilliniresistens TaxID=1298735 RepID=A0ABQ5V5P3_9PROT|nr:hypothetical protein [Algimonas ampicilliniresistens]GLQ22405.1 hypothetical protein GCM10007853_02790 [Algimonas ampicilliniresistens]
MKKLIIVSVFAVALSACVTTKSKTPPPDADAVCAVKNEDGSCACKKLDENGQCIEGGGPIIIRGGNG